MSKNNEVNEKKVSKKEVKNKKPNVFVRIGRWFKRTFSGMWQELKKVTWPKFPTVVKQTGVVLGVVLFFLVAVTLVNFGLSKLLEVIGLTFS